MLNKKTLLSLSLAALLALGATSIMSFAAEGNGNASGNQNGNQTQGEQATDHDGNHEGIESGRDFGQHVSEHNDHFSGDHNPGRHHQGYSGIKD